MLLDKKYRAKLADVGLAKTLTNCYGCDSLATYMSTGELGTFAWAAPEVRALHSTALMEMPGLHLICHPLFGHLHLISRLSSMSVRLLV